MKRMHKTILSSTLFALVALVTTNSLLANPKSLSQKIKSNANIITVKKQWITNYYKAIGTVKPVIESNLSAQITAKIDEVAVNPGQKVKQGQLLIRLDNRDYIAKVARAEQNVNAQRAVYNQAKLAYQRMKKLINKGYVTKEQFDTSKSNYLQSEANLNQSQKALKEAQIALTYTEIKAPSDGVIINKYVNVGDSAMPGKNLLQFQAKNAFRLVANVPEELIRHIKLNQKLTVNIDSIKNKQVGLVNEIVPSIDPMTRSFTVKVLIPSDADIYPGMFGRLWIPVDKTQVIGIPTTAIVQRGQLQFVELFQHGKTELSLITTGKKLANHHIEVLSGLNPGDQLVIPVTQ